MCMLMKMNFDLPITDNVNVNLRKSPHVLVSGVTGSAKSTALMGINLRAMTSKSNFNDVIGMCALSYFIDPKRSDLSHLRNCLINGEKRVVTTPSMAAKLLRILVENMEQRYSYFYGRFGLDFSSANDEGKAFRPILITIDELSALLIDKKNCSDILSYLAKLILLGRQAGFFVLTGIQRPESSVFPRQISLEYNTRILLKASSADNDTLRMLFPMIDPKQIPRTKGGPGNGLIYEEGQGWLIPRPIQLPNYFSLNIPKVINQIEKNIDTNWFIDESSYWKNI